MNHVPRGKIMGVIFQALCLAANMIALIFLALLLAEVFRAGAAHLNWNFITGYPSRFPGKAGILPAD